MATATGARARDDAPRVPAVKPSLPAGHPEGVPERSLLNELHWALLTGDDHTVNAILAAEEAVVTVREQFAWCSVHRHEYHLEDGCRDCP